jgi:hypothetical protein
LFLRSILGLRVVGDVGIEVAEDVFLGDLWRAVGERDLVEDAVGESFGEGFGVGDVVGEEDYMCDVCGGETCGPDANVSRILENHAASTRMLEHLQHLYSFCESPQILKFHAWRRISTYQSAILSYTTPPSWLLCKKLSMITTGRFSGWASNHSSSPK